MRPESERDRHCQGTPATIPTMRSRQTRVAARAIVGIVALSLLAVGCGGGDDGDTSSTSATTDGGSSQSRAERIRSFGSEADESEAQQAEQAVSAYLVARAEGNYQEACAQLADDFRRTLNRLGKRAGAGGCTGILKASTERLSQTEQQSLADPSFEAVRVERDRGYVIYEADDIRRAIPVSLESESWLVASDLGQSLP